MTTTWQLKCWNSMHIHKNSVLHYLYNIAVGLVICYKAKAKSSRPRPENHKAKKLALRPRPMINISDCLAGHQVSIQHFVPLKYYCGTR